MLRSSLPNLPGAAEGRATGPTAHEARFNVASGSSRPREARPRQFSRFGAVARRAETCASVSAARPCRSVVDHATGRILTTDVHGRASLTLAPKNLCALCVLCGFGLKWCGGAARNHGSRQGQESPGGDWRRVPFRSCEQARARKADSAPPFRVSWPSRTRKRASPDTELHGSVPLEV